MPKACNWPINSAARKAPVRLPMPPTTTTTKASTMMAMSMCRFTASRGTCSAPPNPASADPRNNTPVNSRAGSTPSADAMSRSCVAARTSTPQRVRVNSSHSSASTSGPNPISIRS